MGKFAVPVCKHQRFAEACTECFTEARLERAETVLRTVRRKALTMSKPGDNAADHIAVLVDLYFAEQERTDG